MSKQDRQLDQLLSKLEMDKPSSDFTNDIMQMITADNLSQDAIISKNIPQVEQAPKHMTDLVMDSIIPAHPKSYELLSNKEKRNLILVLAAVTIISSLAAIGSPSVFDHRTIANSIQSLFTSSITISFLVLAAGTGLWIIDQFVRSRIKTN